MLGSKSTFSDWVDMYELKFKMTGHLLREAQTIGRTLDLSVYQLGPGYLGTDGAEILLRRLLCLGCRDRIFCGCKRKSETCRLEIYCRSKKILQRFLFDFLVKENSMKFI